MHACDISTWTHLPCASPHSQCVEIGGTLPPRNTSRLPRHDSGGPSHTPQLKFPLYGIMVVYVLIDCVRMEVDKPVTRLHTFAPGRGE